MRDDSDNSAEAFQELVRDLEEVRSPDLRV
jgi:hypothetical protein